MCDFAPFPPCACYLRGFPAFTFITFYFLNCTFKKYARFRHLHLARDTVESKSVVRFGVADAITSDQALLDDVNAVFDDVKRYY